MKKIKIGVIGCGEVSQIMHIPYIKELSDRYELVALCDLSEELLNKLSVKYQVENIFINYKEMLKMDELDSILVATYDHADIVKIAAANKLHIFVEKPISFTIKEAECMINSCKRNNVKLMVGYMKLYEPIHKYARNLFKKIDCKLIKVHDFLHYNPIITKEVFNILRFSDLNINPKEMLKEILEKIIGPELNCYDTSSLSSHLFLLMGGIHDISVLTDIFGYPKNVLFTDVYQHTGLGPEGVKNGLGLFGNYLITVLDYGNNSRCIIELGGTAKKWMDEEIIAYGIEDTIKLSYGSPFIKNTPAVLSRKFMKDNNIHEKVLNISYEEAFKLELIHFHECIINDKNPLSDGVKAKKDLELAKEIMDNYLIRNFKKLE